MNKVLSSIGMAKKAGKLIIGTEMVVESLPKSKSMLVLIASDASENTKKRINDKTKTYNVRCEELPYTVEELGNTLGKAACACVAVCGDSLIKMYEQAKKNTAEVN